MLLLILRACGIEIRACKIRAWADLGVTVNGKPPRQDIKMDPVEFEKMLEDRLDVEIRLRCPKVRNVEKRKKPVGWVSKLVCGGV